MGKTYVVSQYQTTAVADRLQDLLDLDDEPDMKDRHGQLDVAKVTGTRCDVLFAGAARIHAVDGAELGVVESVFPWLLLLLVLWWC